LFITFSVVGVLGSDKDDEVFFLRGVGGADRVEDEVEEEEVEEEEVEVEEIEVKSIKSDEETLSSATSARVVTLRPFNFFFLVFDLCGYCSRWCERRRRSDGST